MNRQLATLGTLLLTTAPALAQTTDVFVLDEIVVSASLEDTEASRTGASVSVITEEDLEQTGDIRVLDYLARIPGISIRTSGPLGTQAGLTLRGVSQNNIAVRIDGIDVSDPSGPQVTFDYGGLTTGDISRIEVLRGSQSALYGSEAIGGVIDITTKRATEDGSEISTALEFGSYNTMRGNVSFARKVDGFEGAVTLSHTRSDGFSAGDENNGNTEADGYESTRLSFHTEFDLGETTRLILSGFAEESQFDFDEEAAGVVTDGTPDDVTDRDQRGLRAALEFTTGAVDHELSLSWFNIDRRNTGTNAFGAYDFNFEGTRETIGYTGATDIGSGRIVFGAEQTRETYADASAFGSQTHKTRISSLFGEYTVSPTGNLDLSAALRYDDHSVFGDFVTGRLSAVMRLSEDTLIRANLGTGYRAPSNYELYDGFAGNAALQPETSTSFDLGVEHRFGDQGVLTATAFYIEAEDIIDYSFTTFGYVQRAGTSTRKGVELAGGWTFDNGVDLSGSYTYTDSQSDVTLDSSSWTTAVPRHALSATLDVPIGDRFDLAVTGVYAGGRRALGDYAVFNSTLSYEINDKAEAYLRIENLFNKEYQTVPGYGTSDRAFYVGVRATF